MGGTTPPRVFPSCIRHSGLTVYCGVEVKKTWNPRERGKLFKNFVPQCLHEYFFCFPSPHPNAPTLLQLPSGPLQVHTAVCTDCESKPFRFYCMCFAYFFFAPDSRFMIHNSTTLHFISISRHKICCFVLLSLFSFIFCLSFLSEPVSNTLLCYTTESFITAWRVLNYVAIYGGLQLWG